MHANMLPRTCIAKNRANCDGSLQPKATHSSPDPAAIWILEQVADQQLLGDSSRTRRERSWMHASGLPTCKDELGRWKLQLGSLMLQTRCQATAWLGKVFGRRHRFKQPLQK